MPSHDEIAREPLVLTREQVGELLGCSKRTVLRLAQQGELREVRVGKLARYRRSDVEAFINQQVDD